MVLTVFAVKYTYFKPQNILLNPQNILMISYTYQAKFCRTTPDVYVKSMTSIQHSNCVNHISNKGCDNLERHQKYYRCRCLYQNKFYVLQHVKWFYEFTSECETCDWFLASAGHQR